MSDTDEIATLKRRMSALENVVKDLILANLQLINVHNAIINANGLKTEYKTPDGLENAFKKNVAIFDNIYKSFVELNKS